MGEVTGPGGASEGPSVREWADVVRFAVRAPSIHNTQPWRWVLDGEVLSLFADRSRQLTAADPDGRAVLLSCGGALSLAVLRLAAAGWMTVVDRLPEGAGGVLARIRVVGRSDPEPVMVARATAAERRHTERRPFRAEPVPAGLLDELVRAADDGQVYAFAVQQADQRLDLAVAMSWADRVESEDPAYRAELAHWVGPRAAAAGEGVPASAVPHVSAGRPRRTEVPVRDFEAGARGELEVAGDVDEQPAYLVLLSGTDGPQQRLRAGEAYLRVSVEAVRLGLASSAMTQAVDLPGVRERFRALMDWADHPQMVLRVGYPPAEPVTEQTPRRPLSEVFTVAGGPDS
ncbi:MAG: Acg family FMN-binding oxidoreductase [Mycobacteriales bacterium]